MGCRNARASRLLIESSPRSLLVDGGKVAAKGMAAVGTYRLDCTWDEVVARPGDVNGHTHAYAGLAPLGMPEPAKPPRSFVQIQERIWWKLDRAHDEKFFVERLLELLEESVRLHRVSVVPLAGNFAFK